MTAKRTTSCIALLSIAILVSASGCVAFEPEEGSTGVGDESMLRVEDEQAAALDEALLDDFDEIGQPASEGEPELEGSPDVDSEAAGGKAGEPESDARTTCNDDGTICCDNQGHCCVHGPYGTVCQ